MSDDAVEAAFERAVDLHVAGQDDEAKLAYLDVLRLDAGHLSALNNLGTLLFNGGYRSAARTAYRQAVAQHPHSTMARVNLANALYDNNELYQAREQYEAALSIDPDCAQAHQGLAYVLDKLGDETSANYHRDLGYRGHAEAIVPYRGTGRAVPVLLLVSAVGGNVNTDRFLDDRVFFTTKLFADYYDASQPLPFHTFVFNAIGDAELCNRALEGARRIVARTNAPVINRPDLVLATGRAENAERLGSIEHVIAPKTHLFTRDELHAPNAAALLAGAGFTFPLLLRTPGYHTGHHFLKIDAAEGLADALAELPGASLMAIEYFDARSGDGNVRKYRVMIVDGKLYPLHLAIAPRWKVHYFSASMKEHSEHRAEELAFLEDMHGVLGPNAVAALESIARALELDYAGIDFSVDAGSGDVLLFEANATMLVPMPDRDPLLAYRRPAVERIFAAVRGMLAHRHAASLGLP